MNAAPTELEPHERFHPRQLVAPLLGVSVVFAAIWAFAGGEHALRFSVYFGLIMSPVAAKWMIMTRKRYRES